MKKQGILLDGSVSGLLYETAGKYDVVAPGGLFSYEDEDIINFYVGGINLGSCKGKPYITPIDWVAEANQTERVVTHYVVTNIARLLLSIGDVTPEIDAVIRKYHQQIMFCMEPEQFEATPAMRQLTEELGISLWSVSRTHNIVRRSAKGILKETDVEIPVGDGRHVLADVYRPLIPGKYPVVMSMGAFGKSFVNGFTVTEEDAAYFDTVEDQFYETYGSIETKHLLQGAFFRRMGACFGSNPPIPNLAEPADPPMGPPPCLVPVSNVFEQVTADDWVPYGYVVMNIEEYGDGKNPGPNEQFGARNAKDYCAVIEWAAVQQWSSGKVGLYGASYYAMTQYLAAQRHPKGLTAMIPIMGDYDSYRHYIYSGGGLFNRADNMTLCTTKQDYTFVDKAMDEPFWNEETYGPEGQYMSSANIEDVDYPIWPVTEPDASLHGLGSSEAYINSPSKYKKFTLINGAGIHFWMYNKEYLAKHRAFFDYWLKGVENGIMEEPPVNIQIRTGNGSFYWRQEQDWPVPGTEYRRLYLDGSSDSLETHEPYVESCVSYSADVARSEKQRVAGATFVSEPFEEDAELAGYLKAGLYVSSTTTDMELHVQVRVLDRDGNEVIYPSYTSMERVLPLAFGSMKVSHRAADEARSREDYTYHLHTREACQPLTPGEVVYCEVSTFPTSGLIRKGWRLQIDIDPVSNRWVDYREKEYREGSVNTIYCGSEYPSFLQIPVLPKK